MQGRMKLMPCAQLMNDALSQNTLTSGSIAFFTAQKAAGYPAIWYMSYKWYLLQT